MLFRSSQNFLHTQHGTKLFVFLGLLAWFAVSVTLRRFFLPIYLEPWFFFFTLTTMFQNFLDTQHRTAPRGLFRFCCERCGSQVFALCTTWSAVAGQSALVAGGCLLFDARTWLGSGRPGWTDQTVSLFQCPFCSCVLGIVFSCFLDLHYLVLLCRNGSTSNGGSTEGCGTGISASNATVTCGAPTAGLQTGTAGPAACRAPGYRPENSLSGNPLLSWRPARISVFRVPPWGRQLETFFRVCTNEIQLSLERSPHQNLTPIDVERETLQSLSFRFPMATCVCVDHSISCCTHCPSFGQVPPAVVAPHRPRTRCKRARQAWLRTFWVPFSCPPRPPPPEDFGVVRVRREADPAAGRSLLQRQNTGRLGRRHSGVLLCLALSRGFTTCIS